jgi:alcohol dehydrogenase class IV
MLPSFEFGLRTRITFGSGMLNRIGEELSGQGAQRVLVVTDAGVVAAGLLERLLAMLKTQGISFCVYDQVRPNPSSTIIDAGEELRAGEECDAIIGLGGGSSIDTAKGIGILATSAGSIGDYAGANKVRVPPGPVVAIPTTAGTGAEVSTAIAVTDDSGENAHSKFAVRAPLVSPQLALLDPNLLKTVPQRVAIDTGMDTLCHLIEAFVSKGATPMTDLLALDGIQRCGTWLTAFVADRSNLVAAQNMLYAAMLGGIVISQARTGATHTLTRPMGDQVSHGLANAIILPFVMEFNLMATVPKFIRIAKALGRSVHGTDLSAAREAVEAVRQIASELGVPRHLRDIGFHEADIGPLASKAYELEISGLNPRQLEEQDIRSLLEAAY